MRNKKLIFILVFIIILSITSIILGIYINSLSKPKKILEESIGFIHDQGKKYIFLDDKYNVGDTYTMESNIDFNLDSEYYLRDSKNNTDSLKKYNFIKNISKMNTDIVIKQDMNNKTNYIEVNQKIGEEDIVGYKRLVNNSTEYYFINGILKNYVNNGTCNYFEAINNENTTRDDLNYLYDFIFKSLQNNMKDDYFEVKEVNENINSKNTSVNRISIRFTDKNVREILNNILKDLKKDEKANNILSNVYKDFKNYKVKDKTDFFDKEESYILNIYTTKFLSKPLKYEVIHMSGNTTDSYIIEKSNNNTFEFFYLEGDTVTYSSNVKVLDNGISAKIYNSSNNEIGELELEKKPDKIIFNYKFDNNKKKFDINYSSKYTDVVNNKKYTNTIKLDIKYLINKESKLDGNIIIKTDVSNKTKITEEVSSSVLYSKLSDEEKDLIKTKRDRIKERLEK